MKKISSFLLLMLACICVTFAQSYTISRIWDKDYCAFPSIEKFNGKYYIAFREAKSHVFDENGIAEGKCRILVSEDGEKWESIALLSKAEYDLRDPKLSITNDGKLMVIMGGSVYKNRELTAMIPQVSFSKDGENFSDPKPVKFDKNLEGTREWIWRVTWFNGVGYGVTYGDHFALLKTNDGKKYDVIKEFPNIDGFPGESTLRFQKDGTMYMMIRREKGDCMGYFGSSKPPYTEWTWKKMDIHLGGQDFIFLDDDKTILMGSRFCFPHHQKTMILKGSPQGDFEEMAILPSGGDTSYPGMLIVDDQLWMVYYSSKELGRASIYLAKMPLSNFDW